MLAAVLALASSVSWGIGDFMGGLQSRRHALLAVLLISQLVALTLVVIAVLAGADIVTTPARRCGRWAAPRSGSPGSSRSTAALSIGTMSVVAPISATGVAIPVLAGLTSGERPGALQVAGIVLAAAGVILAAREPPGEDAAARRSDRVAIGLAIVAAIGFGSFFASVDRAEETADAAWVLLCSAASTWGCCSPPARSCARTSRVRRRRCARSPRSACSTSPRTCCTSSPPGAGC